MLSCREVSQMIASEDLVGAGWWKRLCVRFRLMICRHCRRFAGQIRAIGILLGVLATSTGGVQPPDPTSPPR